MVGKTSKLRSSLYLRHTSSGKFVLLVPAHDDISLGIPYPHYLLSIIFHLAHLLTPMGTFSCRQSHLPQMLRGGPFFISFIYLLTFDCAGSLLLLCSSARASYCGGFSCCEAWSPGLQ